MPSSTVRPSALPRAALLAALAALLVVAAGLARPGAALAADAPATDDDVTWTVRTASNDLGADRTSFAYTVNPGGSVADSLVVANRGDEPLTLGVYAADGFTTDTGTLDLLTKEATSVGVGVWVRAAAPTVTVQPGRTADVPFTVTVPKSATPGDYVGGVVTTLTQPDDAQGINVDRRLGIKVALRVTGDLAPALAVEDVHVSYSGTANPAGAGDATVTYTLHNTGNAVISAQASAAVTGPFGTLRATGAAATAPPQLLPGERWHVSVPVHDVWPAVRLSATATVVPVVTDASGTIAPLTAVTATAHGWAVPWAALVVVVLLVAAVLLALRARRRARARRRSREDARVQAAVDEALAEAETAARR
jgi:hypothetical protein